MLEIVFKSDILTTTIPLTLSGEALRRKIFCCFKVDGYGRIDVEKNGVVIEALSIVGHNNGPKRAPGLDQEECSNWMITMEALKRRNP